VTTSATNQFSDSVSTLAGIEPDICGNKEVSYEIDSFQTSDLTGENNSPITFSPNTFDKVYGKFTATQTVKLTDYPEITKKYSFNVTILAISSVVVPIIENQDYKLNSEPLLISFDPFQINPNDTDVGRSSIEVFLFKCVTIPQKIDISSDCFLKVFDFDWITFDSKTRTITVKTSKIDYLGEHQVFVIQFFQLFIGVNPFTTFKVKIQAADSQTFEIKKAPYFE